MLKTALGGGFIVGFMCIAKVLLSKINTSEFGHAFYYSLNYAIGFTLIYLLHFTLATKQPAMTSAAIIKAIEQDRNNKVEKEQRLEGFSSLFSRLFRSQFIAFVGNVVMAFPVALLLVWLFELATGENIAQTKWISMIEDASPVHSLLIFHSMIAGVFLFVSGIISGSSSNTNKYEDFYFRIKENPFLKNTFGVKNTQKMAKWLDKNLPGIWSNVWFGIFMGSTASIGHFVGLPLDIRHITFVSGSVAIAAYGSGFTLTLSQWAWALIGIVVVGFLNFIVSFSFSLYIALKSRNIPFVETFPLAKSVWKHFKNKPKEFFFPSSENDLNTEEKISENK